MRSSRDGYLEETNIKTAFKAIAVHKLVPANDKQRNAIEVTKRMIWWFHGGLTEYKLAPNIDQADIPRFRFDRIRKRARTGYATLDSLLRRLFRNKAQRLLVLDRPEIPLDADGAEYDNRAYVMKRKISGGTVSERGRWAGDVMLGLHKTCRKQGLSFFQFIGDRLGIPGPKIPALADLVRHATA